MIRKNFLNCIFLTGLFFFACKKEDNSFVQNATASVVAPNKISTNTLNDSVTEKTEQPDSTTTTKRSDFKPLKNNIIEGRFVARNCENGRFSIVIANSGDISTFKVFDGKKVIKSGKATISKDPSSNEINVTMGNIGGIYADGILTIQNYGNSMNEFEHFTQCEDKYLEFTKE